MWLSYHCGSLLCLALLVVSSWDWLLHDCLCFELGRCKTYNFAAPYSLLLFNIYVQTFILIYCVAFSCFACSWLVCYHSPRTVCASNNCSRCISEQRPDRTRDLHLSTHTTYGAGPWLRVLAVGVQLLRPLQKLCSSFPNSSFRLALQWGTVRNCYITSLEHRDVVFCFPAYPWLRSSQVVCLCTWPSCMFLSFHIYSGLILSVGRLYLLFV